VSRTFYQAQDRQDARLASASEARTVQMLVGVRFETLGAYVRPLAPEETAAFIRSEQDLWRPVVREILVAQ